MTGWRFGASPLPHLTQFTHTGLGAQSTGSRVTPCPRSAPSTLVRDPDRPSTRPSHLCWEPSPCNSTHILLASPTPPSGLGHLLQEAFCASLPHQVPVKVPPLSSSLGVRPAPMSAGPREWWDPAPPSRAVTLLRRWSVGSSQQLTFCDLLGGRPALVLICECPHVRRLSAGQPQAAGKVTAARPNYFQEVGKPGSQA